MANFDISFLNPAFRKSSAKDYGFLTDQLDIKRSQLESDGKLSPGDYDLLVAEAQRIYAHPGLTAAQRSNIEVKVAGFQKEKKVNTAKDLNDIAVMNREVKDDTAKIGLRFSNDPQKFLQAQGAVQNAKIDRLSTAIDQLEQAGDDASAHLNELTATLNDYNDTLQALSDTEGFTGGAPSSNYATYLITNSKGEIVDMKIGRIGSQSGYNETNGVYGGLPVYGKINRKDQSGNKIFTLGNQNFSASDIVIPNPDGTMKPSVLISSDKQKQGGAGFTISESGYTQVDPSTVRPQSAIRDGGWVEGDKGFLYQRLPDGNYKKYVNASKEKLGITENDIIKVPRSFEQGISRSVTETIDSSIPPAMPAPADIAPQPAGPSASSSAQPQPMLGQGSPKTPAPTERAPQTAPGIADRAMSAVKGFFGNLFGK